MRGGTLLALLLGLWLILAGPARADDHELELTTAEFGLSEQGPWQTVALPDTWSQRGLSRPGRGFYRLRFRLDAAPDRLWALRLARLSTNHELRVNGQLVSGGLPLEARVLRRPVPVLVSLPPSLLRAGENLIEIEVDNGVRAGLSPLELGPAALVESEFLAGYHLQVTLPQMLNVASGGVCLLALFLWWRRRSEAALGAFAVLGIIASVRNYGYYHVASAEAAAISDFLFFAAQVASVVLLGVFAMALAGRAPRAFKAALAAGAPLLLLSGAVATPLGQLNQVRALAYPLLLLAVLPALWLVATRARELRAGPLRALLAGLVVVLGAGVHDYLYQQGHTSVMHGYWLPYAVPVALVAFAAVLMQRVVGALNQVEELNLTLEQRVRDRTLQLQQANRAKSRFLAAASHDLRQPVVSIGLLVGLLRERITEPAQRALAVRLDDAVAAMESLLAGLLDLSRLESGGVQPRWQAVPLQPIFDAIAAQEGEAAQRKGLQLRVRPTTLAVHADALLVEQIVRNFVSNALRYTARGGVLLAARRTGDGRVRLQVWDTGRGIEAARQSQVFDDFVQLDASARVRREGMGLGLPIVRRSAALLGAPLTLRSRPGRGSCFGVTLAAAGSAQAAASVPAPADVSLGGLTVVLVEDDGTVRDALGERLTAWGARVWSFDAPQALRIALDALPPGQRQADLIVTDLHLPGGSGFDVIALARNRFGALPALVITGDTAPADVVRLSDLHARLLHKPFRAEELYAAISELLGR